jgi:hypothetical protein
MSEESEASHVEHQEHVGDCEGAVYQEFVPPGQTVNQHYYLDILKRLREQFCRKHQEGWRKQDWLLHHDNAPAHTAFSVQRFLAA